MIKIHDRVRVTNVISTYFNCGGEVKDIVEFSLIDGLKKRFYVLFPDSHKISFWEDELEKVRK